MSSSISVVALWINKAELKKRCISQAEAVFQIDYIKLKINTKIISYPTVFDQLYHIARFEKFNIIVDTD